MFTFMDDEPVTVPDEDLTWQASHTLVAKQCYLRLQDAARKAASSLELGLVQSCIFWPCWVFVCSLL